ncbi:SIR2 family protein [Mucilaginibacter sp. HC2]|uniref:SIR2 family NAD-dependent protein deacylase n=1 Tax=Mucilaginibacter inviolabilis TaxID=2714892 RepID=UPI00140A9934|nr:SIR2 family protein [Mucilaginibacter inviolabilis]NHA04900.1 SIR2 family protein [Mucilaginibacter inviolabilis]
MEQQKLFEAIRQEDVVIFAGAGFSRYAGYPLGGKLAEILTGRLSEDEKLKVSVNAPLDYLSEEIVRIKRGSREMINSVLDDVFAAPAISTSDHDLLASIPHFRTIITTNYDALFENAFGDTATLIYKDTDLANWRQNGVNILKIHGDLADKSSIILTREDYARFYHKDYSSPFWATIIKAIATKTILFLGYGYEDPNVWAIFEHVYNHLGENRKRAYFVSPGASDEKIDFLQKRGIHYIKHTGESFLCALTEDIREHIFEDMRKKWLSPETFRKFTSNHQLSVSLQDKGDSYQVHSISGKNGEPMHGNMRFKFDPDGDIDQRFQKFFEDGQFDQLEFNKKELATFTLNIEGLKLFGEGDLAQVSFKKMPKIIPFDLVFSTEGFEMRNLTAQIYGGKKSVTFKTKLHTLNFQITIVNPDDQEPDARWSMEHDAIYRNVNEELEVHEFLKYFFLQKEATIYLTKETKISKQCPTYDKERVSNAETYLEYFKGLKEVERAFGVRFTDFYPIDQESVDDLNWILQVIRGQQFEKGESMEMSFGELPSETIDSLSLVKEYDKPLEFTVNSDLTMILHNQRLPIPGMHTEIPYPEVTNIEELRSGGKVLKVKSRTGTIYQKFMLKPFPSID